MNRRALVKSSIVAAMAAVLPRRAVALLPAVVAESVAHEQREAVVLARATAPVGTTVRHVVCHSIRIDGDGFAVPYVSVIPLPVVLRPGDALELRVVRSL